MGNELPPFFEDFMMENANFCHTPSAIKQWEDNNRWISVKNSLPENAKEVLIYSSNSSVPLMLIGWYDHQYNSWTSYDIDNLHVTYWQPLPGPPNE